MKAAMIASVPGPEWRLKPFIAAGDIRGGAIVATVDPEDLRSLAAYATKAAVVDLDA
ncbi:MAG TPA: hypothetical protein VHL53_13890 [Acidimicrobiia bacterium]|nr:hypothetical protein [Acidimicrobiia bacterium]